MIFIEPLKQVASKIVLLYFSPPSQIPTPPAPFLPPPSTTTSTATNSELIRGMAAYAAVISLKNTLHHILYSRIWLVPPSFKIVLLVYKELNILQGILARLDSTCKGRSRKKVNALDGRIKETLWKLEDLLESLLFDEIISQFESPRDQMELRSKMHRRRMHEQEGSGDVLLFSIDLQSLQDDVDSCIQELKDMEKEYNYEVDHMSEDDDEEPTSSRIGSDGKKSEMVGLSDQFEEVKGFLLRGYWGKHVYTLVGTAGVGKTALVMKIVEDPSIMSHFECRVWITVGRKMKFSQVLRCILSQLDPNMVGITEEVDEKIRDYLKEMLEGKKCLIVLDDVWEAEVLNSLMSSLQSMECNGILQILLTTRDRTVIAGITPSICRSSCRVVRFLNEEESMVLLCKKVFGEEILPPQLEKAAKKIARNCEGLPLMIVTVADLLSRAQNFEPEYWDEVAEMRNSVFTDAYVEIAKVLFPSYDYLPQYLKMFFLYMGVFPPDYDIPQSKLINMMMVEGWFLDTGKQQSLEDSVSSCLQALGTFHSLVLFNQKSIWWFAKLGSTIFKNSRLHSSWRYVCRGEARRNKLFHVLNRHVDGSEQGVMQGQRCLCLQNNILFAIEDFCSWVKSYCANSTRSLLFFGPYHQYSIPINVGFKLLRVLDALKLRFYVFPTEILTLVLLEYLALTCNGELPATISKLFKLRVLIIHPHTNIKHCGDPSYVPVEVWDMQELEHIEILGKSFVVPNRVASLEKLSTLVGVNATICTILDLFKRIPSIRKLRVLIELTPHDDHGNLLNCFHGISRLESLNTFKCSIMNPVFMYRRFASWAPSSFTLPHGLKKLHLSGMSFSSSYMDVVGSLPCLEVLKLRCYAFRGSKWETREESFPSLMFLLIEDSDLVRWKPRFGSFPKLNYLSMKHCYKLRELQWPSDSIKGKIELIDCNPLAVARAMSLLPRRGTSLDVTASSSFDEQPVIEIQRHKRF